MNPSANVLVFGDFNVHYKDRLTYSSETDKAGKLCYIFFISNDLNQTVNSVTRIPNVFGFLSCGSGSVFVLHWLSPIGNLWVSCRLS